MSEDKICFFCGCKCEIYTGYTYHPMKQYECAYCGCFLLDERPGAYDIDIKEPAIKFKMACVLNEKRLKGLPGVALSDRTNKEKKFCNYPQISAGELLNEFPKKPNDFLNRAILNLSRLTKQQPFEVIRLDLSINRDGLHFFIQDQQGCLAFLRELAEQGYIRFNKTTGGSIQSSVFFRTARFWEAVGNLQNSEINNKRVFVAMWFDKSMDAYYKNGIEKAIEEAGYVPARIDLQDFNEKICDEIIAEIKRTKFLIADFSGLRSGVFFEAGFAKGLGREVIFTVREEDVEQLKLHFDTRQYNHIVYNSPEDLQKKLYNRICATIV